MVGNQLSKVIFKKMTSLGINMKIPNNCYCNQTIKDFLLDQSNVNDFNITNLAVFSVDISIDDYNSSLLYDFRLSKNRIIEQKNHLEVLYKNSMQVAWIIVTAYYCNFFIANELSKLYGKYIINFSKKDMLDIIQMSDYSNSTEIQKLEDNNSYEVEVSTSQYHNFIKLKFHKKSPKPHRIVWENLAILLKDLNSEVSHEKILFENIVKSKKNWQNPSLIRNNWNYRYSNYYSETGNNLGQNFLKLIQSKSSTLDHFNNRRIQPTESNVASSIAFIYHLLTEAFEDIDRKFDSL